MSIPVAAPSKGQAIRAQWAADVTRNLNDCAAALAAGAVREPANRRTAVAAPHPWMVVGGTDDGDAKLTVYVPQGSLVVADSEIAPGDIDGISAVEEAPGYYTVDDLDDLAATAAGAQPLYLVVWRDDTATDPATNAAVTLDPESITGTVILQATIARVWASTVETAAGGSTTYGAVAAQLVRSAIAIGAAGAQQGGSSGGSSQTLTVVTDVTFDPNGYPPALHKKYANISFTGTIVFQNRDAVVFETTKHSEET